jgi:hypothetical protein
MKRIRAVTLTCTSPRDLLTGGGLYARRVPCEDLSARSRRLNNPAGMNPAARFLRPPLNAPIILRQKPPLQIEQELFAPQPAAVAA